MLLLGDGISEGDGGNGTELFRKLCVERAAHDGGVSGAADTHGKNARVFPFLVYDGADWEAGMRCVACQICEKECPPKCIYIEKSADKKPDYVGKAQFYPARFDIDISVCMSCQICVEVCPFEAIKMDTQFELATTDRFGGLLYDRKELSRSNEYYHEIHPTEATEVDERLAEEKAKVEAKAKAAAEAAVAKAAAAAASACGAGQG